MENPGYAIEEKEFSHVTSSPTIVTQLPIKLYRRRWVILAIFSLISMMNEVLWISLSAVSTVVRKYYQVSFHAVNWLPMIFSAVYFTVIGAVFILNKYGLKVTIIGGALLNAVSSAFRLAGYTRNGYTLSFVGSTVGGIGQSFLIFVPPTLSSVWFGEKERARASAIGMLMNMSGVALGFLMGSLMVPNTEDLDGAVKHGMFMTLLLQAVICVVLLLASIILIQKEPATPPTHSQALNIERRKSKLDQGKLSKASTTEIKVNVATIHPQSEVNQSMSQSTGFIKNVKPLMKNLTFHLMIQSYGIYFGLFNTTNTLVTQITGQKFPHNVKQIGLMGFSSVIFGLASIMLSGIWIDKTHRYKYISVGIFSGCSLFMLACSLALKFSDSFVLVFVLYCIYGFFSYPYLCVGLEFIAELMYPVKESNLSFISFFVGTLYGVIFTNSFTIVIHRVGGEYAGFIIAIFYFIGLVCVCLVKGELKRFNLDQERAAK